MIKRWAAVLISIVILITPTLALADDWPITSAHGMRWHPIFQKWIFHDGVDFGLDSGVAIPSPEGGTVTVAGTNGGYGNYVEIDHGNGITTFYGHLSGFVVSAGQTVSKGQVLGYVGSTGWSTGPHLHLGMSTGGESSDPIPYLQSKGWAISNIPDPSAVAFDPSYDLFGYSDASDVSWDLTTFYEMGKFLQETIKVYADGCKNGLIALKDEAINLFWVFAVIRLSWFAIQRSLGGESFAAEAWIPLILQFGFILYLILNWPEIVDDVIATLFSTGASEFFGGGTAAAENFSKPGDIVSKGVQLIEPAFTYISKNPFMLNILGILFCEAIALLILTIFLLIGIVLVIYHIEFYIISVVAILSLPFALTGGMFSKVKAFPGGVVGSLIGSALKILIASIFITLIINVLSSMKPVEYELSAYMKILVASLLFLLIILKIPSHVSGLFKGHVRF